MTTKEGQEIKSMLFVGFFITWTMILLNSIIDVAQALRSL